MQEPMYGYMKVGIVHFKAFPQVMRGEGPILETLARIAEDDFFTAVEVGWIKDDHIRNEVRHMMEQSHLTVCYATQSAILTQKLNLNAFDPGERQKAIRQVKSCIREACDVGASWVRLLSGKDPGDEKREEAKKLLVDSLLQICDFVKREEGPRLTLKIFDRDIDKESLIGHFTDARDIAVEVRKSFPDFGLLADLSHFPLLREDPEVAIPLVREFLQAAHIGNCYVKDRKSPLYGDLQPRFGVPGGEIDVPEVAAYFRLLKRVGFLNLEDPPVVSAEVRPLLAGERPELIIANTKRVIREAWARA
jgi:sugar phosphate isomerase/epimerase